MKPLFPKEPRVTISLTRSFWETLAMVGIGMLFIVTLAFVCLDRLGCWLKGKDWRVNT